jgi:hypothetical protein
MVKKVDKTANEQANELAVKQQFFDRAKALSELPEVFRCAQVALLIRDMLALGVRSESEIFQIVYGDPSGRRYWDAHLSETISVFTLAHILSGHLAESVEQLEMAEIAIIRAFRDAAEAGEGWFVGETTPLLSADYCQDNSKEVAKVKIRPRPAAEWLLSKPKREHLVPESLRRFLQFGGGSINVKAPTSVRSVTKKIAERFVADYVSGEQASGRRPTLSGLEAAAKKADMRGGREYLRAAFHQSLGTEVRRGRPPKTST